MESSLWILCAVTTIANFHLEIIRIKKIRSSQMDHLPPESIRATNIKSLISIQSIYAEGNRKKSASDEWKKHTKAWLIRVHCSKVQFIAIKPQSFYLLFYLSLCFSFQKLGISNFLFLEFWRLSFRSILILFKNSLKIFVKESIFTKVAFF